MGSFWHVCTCPVGRAVVALSTPGVVGGRPEWRGELLLRHTVCAPRRRGVRGCICCAPACLLFLHCCVYLEFSVSSASDKDAGSAALRVRQRTRSACLTRRPRRILAPLRCPRPCKSVSRFLTRVCGGTTSQPHAPGAHLQDVCAHTTMPRQPPATALQERCQVGRRFWLLVSAPARGNDKRHKSC